MKRFRIPDMDVRLDDQEVAVTQTRAFQRLSDIKQLGLASLVYPFAAHTRGAHSLQTLHEADKIISAVRSNESSTGAPGPFISEEEERNVRMAALLHDIGHIAYSHMLEDENRVLPKHDSIGPSGSPPGPLEVALSALKGELRTAGRPGFKTVLDRVEKAEQILLCMAGATNGVPLWQCDLVGNTVCADLLAYISADARWTGIEKRPGSYRIYDYLLRRSNRLCVKLTKGTLRNDVVSCITDLLDMRYALTERVIFHHGKAIASAMLGRAALVAGIPEVDRSMLLNLGDESLLTLVRDRLIQRGEADAVTLIDGLRTRQLYKRIFQVGLRARIGRDEGKASTEKFCEKFRDPSTLTPLLNEIEDRHHMPRGSLVMWCPKEETSMKLAQTSVVWDEGDGEIGPYELRGPEVEKRFPGVHERVTSIERQYLDLWTCWVAVHPKYVHLAARIRRNLENRLEVRCDPLFVDGYLRKLPGYPVADEWATAVTEELEPVTDAVTDRVTSTSQRPRRAHESVGGASSDILHQAKQVIDERVQPAGAMPEARGVKPVPRPESDRADPSGHPPESMKRLSAKKKHETGAKQEKLSNVGDATDSE